MARTTRKQGAFGGPVATLAEAEATLAELVATLEVVEAGCNRCAGNGTSWWQKGTGTCCRCGGSGKAIDGLRSAIAGTESRIAYLHSPAGRFDAWIHANWLKGGNGAAHVWLMQVTHGLLVGGSIDVLAPEGFVLRRLFDAVAEGRQTGPIRPETAEAIRAEAGALRRSRSAG